MNSTAKPQSARFPNVAWAWPPISHHQLLMASACPDEDRAFQSLESWLSARDLNDANFAEHRLLAAVAGRFGERLKPFAEYPRLVGIQRLNWTLSRMAVAEVKPVLAQMAEAGLKIVLLKGASRVALDPGEQKIRTSWDVDILLSDQDMLESFKMLIAAGWQSARGESELGLRARIGKVRARNFKKGRFGDVDLHRHAYRQENASAPDDKRLWSQLNDVDYYGVPCFVPRPEERLAMAIAHGGLDGESHSDWIMDCIRIATNEDICWSELRGILERRRLLGHAEIAFGYMRRGLSVEFSNTGDFDIGLRDGWMAPRQISSLIVAKHPSTLGIGMGAVRKSIVTLRKMRESVRTTGVDRPMFVARLNKSRTPKAVKQLTRDQALEMSGFAGPGDYELRLEAMFNVPHNRKRVELEINSQSRSICHLRALAMGAAAGVRRAKFKGRVHLTNEDANLNVQALPGKFIEQGADVEELNRYGALEFGITDFKIVKRG